MSEIKYYDGGAGMPDAAFYDGFNRVFAYGGADRSHETDSGILTGVTLTTGYGAIAATASAGTAQQLTTGTLAASTAKYVNVAIASGANSETLLRTLQGTGAALAVEVETVTVSTAGSGNSAPVAENLEISTYRETSVSGDFKALDPEGDLLSFRITTPPGKGSVTVQGGSFVYTPAEGKRGFMDLLPFIVDSFLHSYLCPHLRLNRPFFS